MQDNAPQPEFNDPFVDHAWQQMRGMLDREMPERPLAFWWKRYGLLLLFLLLALGLAWGGWFFFRSPVDPEERTSAPAVIAERADSPERLSPLSKDDENCPETDVPVLDVVAQPGGPVVVASSRSQVAAPSIPENLQSVPSSPKEINTEVESSALTMVHTSPLFALERRSIQVESPQNMLIPKNPTGSATGVGVPGRKDGLLSGYADAGGFAWPGTNGFLGLDAGLGITINPDRFPVSFSLGLGYQLISLGNFPLSASENSRDAGLSFSEQFQDASMEPVVIGGDTIPINSFQENTKIIDRRRVESQLHYLVAPLRLEGQVGDRITLFGGVKALFLLGSSGHLYSTVERDILVDASAASFDQFYYSEQQTQAPKTDFWFSAGIGYRISQPLSLEVGFQRGLRAVPRLEGSSPIQGGRIGLRYHFP